MVEKEIEETLEKDVELENFHDRIVNKKITIQEQKQLKEIKDTCKESVERFLNV